MPFMKVIQQGIKGYPIGSIISVRLDEQTPTIAYDKNNNEIPLEVLAPLTAAEQEIYIKRKAIEI